MWFKNIQIGSKGDSCVFQLIDCSDLWNNYGYRWQKGKGDFEKNKFLPCISMRYTQRWEGGSDVGMFVGKVKI